MSRRPRPAGRRGATALLLLLLLLPLAVAAHRVHEHGVAALSVAFDAGVLVVELDTPLDNLLGFERAPRDDAERRAAEAAVARLRAAEGLLAIDPAARCGLAEVVLVSAPLGLGGAGPPDAGGHADLNGRFEFRCAGTAPAWVDVRLFDAFPRLGRLQVQAAGPAGQRRAVLRRAAAGGAARLALPR